MPNKSHTNHVIRYLFSQSVNRILILGFVIVALVPVSILGVKSYQIAWKDAWREIHEKHRLLAMNLAAPISIYINDHRASLGFIASSLGEMSSSSHQWQIDYLKNAIRRLSGFRSLTLVDQSGKRPSNVFLTKSAALPAS